MIYQKNVSHQIFDDDGILDIHKHCFYGNMAQIKVLVETTGCIDSRTVKKKRIPLHFAVAGEQIEVCEYLIKQKTSPNSKDIDGMTPIFFAAFQNNFQLFTTLFGLGASLSARTDHRLNLFHAASSVNTPETFNFLKYLSTYKALGNQPTKEGNTPLFYACKQGNLFIVTTLLQDFGHQNLKQRNNQGLTLLHVAAKCGHLALVEYLLKVGIDPRIRTLNNETAVMMANDTANASNIIRLITRAMKSWPEEENSMEIEGFQSTFQTAKRMKS